MAPATTLQGGSGGSKRKSPMTSPLKSNNAINKRAKPDAEEDEQVEAGPSTVISLDNIVQNGNTSHLILDASTPASPGSPSSPAVADKAELMKDGGFTQVMSKEEKRKEKKRLKEAKARQANVPQFLFNTDGFRYGKPIGIAHIRELLLHIVTENAAPNWIVVQNRTNISHTCCIFVPGVLPEHLGLQSPTSNLPFPTSGSSSSSTKSQLPVIPQLFSHACPTRAPGDQRKLHSVLSTLLQTPLSDGEKKRREQAKRQKAGLKNDKTMSNSDPRQYLLTPNEMLDNDYPLPDYVKLGDEVFIPGEREADGRAMIVEETRAGDLLTSNSERKGQGEGWVETPVSDEKPPVDGNYRVLAIDCEMCKAGELQILARVSIVDCATGEKVYDELCVPAEPITDYLTQWSGMTQEKLATATLTLADIQQQLINPKLLTSNTILLGHSLECDLQALKIRHPLCIDTALLYKHPRGAPFKSALKYLTKQWLGREIQNHGPGGHDSEEDARACMDLLRLKLVHGPDFASSPSETESIFERMARHAFNSERPGKTSAICDYGNTAQWHGSKAKTAVPCNDDEDVINGMIENIPKHDFTFGRLLELSTASGWNTTRGVTTDFDDTIEGTDIPSTSDQLSQALQSFNDHLQRLHASLPPASALIVITGHSDPRKAINLLARKTQFERLYKTLGAEGVQKLQPEQKWMTSDDRELEAAAMKAREGMAFFCVK